MRTKLPVGFTGFFLKLGSQISQMIPSQVGKLCIYKGTE